MIDTYKKPQREGLETARCPTGVGSNPTPRTMSTPKNLGRYLNYLLTKNFKVTKAVKAVRGEWVSQGKHSYWWVPATQEVET